MRDLESYALTSDPLAFTCSDCPLDEVRLTDALVVTKESCPDRHFKVCAELERATEPLLCLFFSNLTM